MEKRVYSLNLIAYIKYRTGIEPSLFVEGSTAYAVFPETAIVGKAINEFKSDDCEVKLHSFLNQYKDLRRQVVKLRETIKNDQRGDLDGIK